MTSTAFDPTALASHLQRATAYAAQAEGSSTGSATSSDITSSDFLTLLVTQLKNQDPTQPTDPTQYVTQLVNVNSLEQLINVNTQLTSLGGSLKTTTTTTPATGTGSQG